MNSIALIESITISILEEKFGCVSCISPKILQDITKDIAKKVVEDLGISKLITQETSVESVEEQSSFLLEKGLYYVLDLDLVDLNGIFEDVASECDILSAKVTITNSCEKYTIFCLKMENEEGRYCFRSQNAEGIIHTTKRIGIFPIGFILNSCGRRKLAREYGFKFSTKKESSLSFENGILKGCLTCDTGCTY